MLYAIIGYDVNDSLEKRQLVRNEHLSRLEKLKQEGRLILAGPFPKADGDQGNEMGFSGSLIVAEFDSLEKAQSWANEDPYMLKGIYERVQILPFKKTLP